MSNRTAIPFLLAGLLTLPAGAAAQDGPAAISLPPSHKAGAVRAPAQDAGADPAPLYRSRTEAGAAASKAAYTASTVEKNRGRAIRLYLIAAQRDPTNAIALYNLAVLCEQDGRWSEAVLFLREALKSTGGTSPASRAAASELPRARLIEQLEATSEGSLRRRYDRELLAIDQVAKIEKPYATLAAIPRLSAIDKDRWETSALSAAWHAQTGQYAECLRELETAANLAPEDRRQSLRAGAKVAAHEATYREHVRFGDGLWEEKKWSEAARAYQQAWHESPYHSDTAMQAVVGYLLGDAVEDAARILAELRMAATPLGAKAQLMLQALGPILPEALRESQQADRTSASVPLSPADEIRAKVGTLTTPAMELANRPVPSLLEDSTPVIPLPDRELDPAVTASGILSSESAFQKYREKMPATVEPAPRPQPEPEPAPAPAPVPALRAASEPAPPKPAPARIDPPAVKADEAVVMENLTIDTEPGGAEIVVDKETPCKAPCRVALPAGRHTLVARLEHYEDALRIFQVSRGGQPSLRVSLTGKHGFLVVESEAPDAKVFLDNQPTGKTTPARFTVLEGDHLVGVEINGTLRTDKTAVPQNTLVRLRF